MKFGGERGPRHRIAGAWGPTWERCSAKRPGPAARKHGDVSTGHCRASTHCQDASQHRPPRSQHKGPSEPSRTTRGDVTSTPHKTQGRAYLIHIEVEVVGRGRARVGARVRVVDREPDVALDQHIVAVQLHHVFRRRGHAAHGHPVLHQLVCPPPDARQRGLRTRQRAASMHASTHGSIASINRLHEEPPEAAARPP
eukprot:147499-Rhodomonas_salina.2